MNVPVLIWTLAAGAGVLLSAYLMVEALLDWRALGPIVNGRRKRAWARFVAEVIRLVIHLVFLVVGLAALFQIDLRPWPVIGLVAAAVLLIVNSLIAVWVQRLEPSPRTLAEADDSLARTAEAAERTADNTDILAEKAKGKDA